MAKDFVDNFGVAGDDGEQGAGDAVGLGGAAFPAFDGGDGEAEAAGEIFDGEPGGLADFGGIDRWDADGLWFGFHVGDRHGIFYLDIGE